jgi:hypothetical protein
MGIVAVVAIAGIGLSVGGAHGEEKSLHNNGHRLNRRKIFMSSVFWLKAKRKIASFDLIRRINVVHPSTEQNRTETFIKLKER